MITNTGKNILAKYMIGQAPSYASYMAFGSGQVPKDINYSFTQQDYSEISQKECLDFELFRTPITSRGYVTDIVDGVEVSKVVLTAELPPEQRYQITEIGLFSAKSNPSASGRDSRIIYTFTESEDWQYHDETTSSSLGAVVVEPLYADTEESGTASGDIINPDIRTTPAFILASDNVIFSSDSRKSRYEGGRYLNRLVMVPGDMSHLDIDEYTNNMYVLPKDNKYNGAHVHYAGISINLEKNSSEDLIKTAFTVVSKDGSSSVPPTKVYIMIEFSSSDSFRPNNYARLPIVVSDADLLYNRYIVDTQSISSLQKSESFSWSDVNIVKIYATAFETIDDVDVPTDKFYIGLDAVRIENITSVNPLYGMTGYSLIKTDGAETLVKDQNSTNLVEFRFGLDVV